MVRNPLPTSLILGVPTPTAMALMGWSSAAMAKRYQHLIDTIWMSPSKSAACSGTLAMPQPSVPRAGMRLRMRLGRMASRDAERASDYRPWSGWRRMRDSNSRGLAPNTLSKSVGVCSRQVGALATRWTW